MKIILNEDVKHLGEEGDVKNVAAGYARNFLLPRNLAVPYNELTLAYFESRKAEIEERKALKRKDAAGIKEKLQSQDFTVIASAGPNGKLYGAVTTHTIADVLKSAGFDVERKRIEIQGAAIKTTGKYTCVVRLYEAETAVITVLVKTQEEVDAAAKAEKEKLEKQEEPSA